MGGWYADVLVGYVISLFRMITRKLRTSRSKGWREALATVVGASCQESWYLPRPVAEIIYTYRVDGGFYGGVDEKPFFSGDSAKEYAGRFARGDNLVVRVKPGEPEISIVREEDQVGRTQSTTDTGVNLSHK